MPAQTPATNYGTVTSWNDDRGFGSIKHGLTGERLFVHRTELRPPLGDSLRIGQHVTFKMILRTPREKQAKEVSSRELLACATDSTRSEATPLSLPPVGSISSTKTATGECIVSSTGLVSTNGGHRY
jgi:cold shock CspA family protein